MRPNLLAPHTVTTLTIVRAIGGAAVMAGALVLDAILAEEIPSSRLLFLYPAVFIAAWKCFWPGGIAAIVTASVALPYWFFPPTGFAVGAHRDLVDLITFVGVSVVLVSLVVEVRRSLAAARAATELAEKAKAAKDTVLAIVAHDLRNPLQTIGISTELLASRIGSGDPSVGSQVQRIHRAAARARRLVDNILDSAETDSMPLPITPSVVSLAAILDETLAPFFSIAEARHIELDVRSLDIDGEIVCDRDRIVQVLSNLIGNALQYTEAGGKVSVAVRRDGKNVHFEVADTGIGMTKDALGHAFERLWHGQGHGSGLGLWIAKALVEAHGGTIEATSEPGRGTCVAFVLPQSRASVGRLDKHEALPIGRSMILDV